MCNGTSLVSLPFQEVCVDNPLIWFILILNFLILSHKPAYSEDVLQWTSTLHAMNVGVMVSFMSQTLSLLLPSLLIPSNQCWRDMKDKD